MLFRCKKLQTYQGTTQKVFFRRLGGPEFEYFSYLKWPSGLLFCYAFRVKNDQKRERFHTKGKGLKWSQTGLRRIWRNRNGRWSSKVTWKESEKVSSLSGQRLSSEASLT